MFAGTHRRRVRLTMLVGVIIAMACWSSCADRSPNAPKASESESQEATFADQAAAVRSGKSDQIRLARQRVTDEDLKLLAGLEQNLRRLNLSDTTIGDEGLAQIAGMKHLEQLRLASAQLTDDGLGVLEGLSDLKHLHLIGAPITDVGLAHLHKLNGLSSLYLDGTHGTEQGMLNLAEALPNVHLHFDGGHHGLDHGAANHEH